jgi:hypothetical protein
MCQDVAWDGALRIQPLETDTDGIVVESKDFPRHAHPKHAMAFLVLPLLDNFTGIADSERIVGPDLAISNVGPELCIARDWIS